MAWRDNGDVLAKNVVIGDDNDDDDIGDDDDDDECGDFLLSFY